MVDCLLLEGQFMSRIVHCQKLNKDAPGLDKPPLPGPLGEKVFENISAEAWGIWLNQQTMLINENKLRLFDPKARAFLEAELEKFLFSEDYQPPEGYTPA